MMEKNTTVFLFALLLYTPRHSHKGYKHFMKLVGAVYVGPRTFMAHRASDATNQLRPKR